MRTAFGYFAWTCTLSTTLWFGGVTLAADAPAGNNKPAKSGRGGATPPARTGQETKSVRTPTAGANPSRKPAKELLADARKAFNDGRDDVAEQLARECQSQGLRAQLFGDSPDKLLEDIAEYRQLEQSWKKDSRSEGAKKARVAYLLKRARQVMEEADPVNAERYVKLADQAGLTGEGPLQSKLALARQLMASRVTAARGSSDPTENASVEQVEELIDELESTDDVVEPLPTRGAPTAPAADDADEADVALPTGDDAGEAPLEMPADAESPTGDDADAVLNEVEAGDMPAEPVDAPAAATGEESVPGFEELPDAPAAGKAEELYRDGKEALKAGDHDRAYELFLEAFRSGERLPARQMTEIREFLSTHGAAKAARNKKKIQLTSEPGALAPADEPADGGVAATDERRQAAADKLRNDVRNARYKAEKLAETDPDAALEILSRAETELEQAQLEPAQASPLVKSLREAKAQVDYARKVNGPKLDLDARNAEVLGSVKRDRDYKLAVEKEFAAKVDEFNQLMREKRFEEAEVLAKQAQQLKPGDEVAELMVLKARFGARDQFNQYIKERKADEFGKMLDDVDRTIADNPYTPDIAYPSAKSWKALTDRREKYRTNSSNYLPSPEEIKIQQSLTREVSLHFEESPLSTVIKHLQTLADINIVLDPAGLEEEGVTLSTPVSIDLDQVKMRTALKYLLDPLRLGHTINDDVLKITSKTRQQGELQTRTYSVADLVVPVQSFNAPDYFNNGNSTMPTGVTARPQGQGRGAMTVSSGRGGNQAFAQFDDAGERGVPGLPGSRDRAGSEGGASVADFTELIDLITSTVQPDSWDTVGGAGSVKPYTTTLSLVIRQTQAVHQEIADLLTQLRRLQDLQVTVEVRFITVSDQFFERIGIDFDFNIQDNAGNGILPNTFGEPRPPFGIGSAAGQTGQQQGQAGQQGQQGQAGQAGQAGALGDSPFQTGPARDLINRDKYGRYGKVVGLNTAGQFTNSLDIPFRQGSFPIGVPQFGGFQPDAGLSVGLAILSDIETFFLISAAQGDQRSNLLFAPKVTLFNGQVASISDQIQRPFVTSVIPTVGFGSTGFQPVITTLPDGISLSVLAVISADRRYVRLSLTPLFSTILGVQTFSFLSGGGAGGQQGQGGGGFGGQGGGGFGGQGGGGFGGQAGFGGIGGFGGQGGGQGGFGGQGGQGGFGGQGGQQGQQGQGGGGGAITLQQPIFGFTTIQTTVSVPDGGTVLLGGVKRLKEGRSMAGVPILNKIPYISRLFKNTGVGREAESVMMMVTPRIIIQEEEEELLGVEL